MGNESDIHATIARVLCKREGLPPRVSRKDGASTMRTPIILEEDRPGEHEGEWRVSVARLTLCSPGLRGVSVKAAR